MVGVFAGGDKMSDAAKLLRMSKEAQLIERQASRLARELVELATSQPETQRRWLAVPWVSQLGPDAAYAPGDCGAACLAMWLRYLGHDSVTVDAVSANVNLPQGYRYTMPGHLIRAAKFGWNVDLYWRKHLSLDTIRAEVDRGQPVILLVHYPALLYKFDPSYQDGHWILVNGYTDQNFVYLDPYFDTADRGEITIPATKLYDAWNSNHLDGNSDRQALRMR